ncbi:DNA topoisomerase 3-alpha isoform X2 [Drosophila hydei]|uniref:DNA topoisomerase n=1 Tax=Drosophila hydei TaxID=7224 RepID=A0A6J1LES5_DROHY|nr:DNA topoisomerase 3-alpha isoform X2 [Drosophila hydei]
MLVNALKCLHLVKHARFYSKQTKDMKFLNVAEKNDAAKTIAGLLSNGTAQRREGYSVYNKVYDFETQVRGRNAKMVMTSVSGHLMELEFLQSYRNWRNVDPRSLFDAPIRKSVSENYLPIKRTLEREVRGCQGLIIWTDCDREGENIGYEIIDVCRAIRPNLTIHRAIFSEITSVAVRRALQQLGVPDKRQSEAVDVRTELDLRTGAAITRFQTMRLQRLFPGNIADKLISYGSCQIPTLGFVAERYKEIEAFVSEPFWKIRVLHSIEDLTVEFNWARNRLFDKDACENYLLLCLAEPEPRATVESVIVKPKHKWRPTPLDTVEMEKLGSRKLKLSAKETMTIAEKLYSKGLISYPRTETNQFSKEFDLTPLVEHQTAHEHWGAFAQRVLEWGPNPRNGNKSDQAHPPIHPTKLVSNLQGNEALVYELVVRHFLACVSKDAVGSETIVNIDIAGEKFSANGLVIHERNYLDVYVYDKWSAKQIHNYQRGQRFEPTEIMLHEGATTAPPLLTEADLIALMEKHGIGTDATHAEHINTIKERGYIGVVEKGALVPGVIGMGLYEGYDAMELTLSKPLLRAEFEADLKRICLGEKEPKLVLREQIAKYKLAYQQIMDKITAMDDKIAQRINETPTAATGSESSVLVHELFQCPKCDQAPLALKPKKNQTSFFIGCLNFPDCKNVIWLPEECKELTVLEECCPTCGEGYKMLKFKLSTPYYRGLFNAPHGWYKNCLRCDELFRRTFNINLDQVKRVGGIVAQAGSSGPGPDGGGGGGGGGWGRGGGGGWGGGGGGGRGGGGGGGRGGGGRGGGDDRGEGRGGKKGGGSGGEGGPASRTRPGSGNSFGSEGNADTQKPTKPKRKSKAIDGAAAGSTTTNSRDNGSLERFFDSDNDGSDEQLLAAAAVAESESAIASQLDEDIAAAFAADDDADFEALLSGDNNHSNNNNKRMSANLDSSLTQWMREAYEAEERPILWGRQAHAAAETKPTVKKARLNEVSPDRASNAVLCSGCHQPARQQTVLRDGPNKGRHYYKCPKPNECKFFQWADHHATAADTTSQISNWGREVLESNSSSSGAAAVAREESNSEDFSWGTKAAAQRSNSQDSNVSNWGSGGTMEQNRSSSLKTFGWGTESGAQPGTTVTKASTYNKNSSWGIQPPTQQRAGVQITDDRNNLSSWGTAAVNPSNHDWGRSRSSQTTSTWNRNDSSYTSTSSQNTGIRYNSSSTITVTQRSATDSNPKCNCDKPAKDLIVRKDGPNKGRSFFACANREKSCGFFQWGDTNEQRANSSKSNGSAAAPAGNRTRRCGLCREEGHTRQKCPRKEDFNY